MGVWWTLDGTTFVRRLVSLPNGGDKVSYKGILPEIPEKFRLCMVSSKFAQNSSGSRCFFVFQVWELYPDAFFESHGVSF